MNLSKLREKYSTPELLWFSALWLQFFRLLVLNLPKHYWFFAPCLDYINVLIWGLCAYKFFFFDHHKAKTLWFSGVVFYGALLSTMLVDSESTREMFNLFVFVLSCKDVSFRKITRHYLAYYSLFLCENLLLTALKLTDRIAFSDRYLLPFLPLHTYLLGFPHYNWFGMWLMMMILLAMLVLYKRNSIYTYLGGLAGSCLLLYLTSSRTSFIVAVLGVVLLYWLNRHPNFPERIPKLPIWSDLMVLGSIVFIFLLIIFYNNDSAFYSMFPRNFAARLAYGQDCLLNSGFSLFGTSEIFHVYLDILFINIGYYNGIVCALCYIALLVLSVHRAAAGKQWDIWIVILMLTLYSLSECLLNSANMMMLYPAFAKLDE